MNYKQAWLVAALIFAAGSAHAYSLQDMKNIAKYKAMFDDELKEANKTCGTHITGTYDLKTEADRPETEEIGRGYSMCSDIFKGIAWVCRNDAGKSAIAKGLKTTTCEYSKGTSDRTEHDKPEISFKKGNLDAKWDWKTGNFSDAVGYYLENNWDPDK